MVPDVTARPVWDAVPAEARDTVLTAAAEELARPARTCPWATGVGRSADGARTVHEDKARRLRERDDPFLDLGAAEIAALFAWTDHALGPHLDIRAPGLRRRLRREADQRVLTPFERVRDWHWIGRDGRANKAGRPTPPRPSARAATTSGRSRAPGTTCPNRGTGSSRGRSTARGTSSSGSTRATPSCGPT
ncbi:hypothetical protein [Nonomuraea sp. NPDC052265]|uniref:hypothetical protein n=1 Tax=Nonomuraea sp. NPDC052265 TaxID=3364374 RepID=UPI0037C93F32